MIEVAQELMTPHEAARWFRRSPSWLRQQGKLMKVCGRGGQPLYHIRVCRAYVLGQLCGLDEPDLKRIQVKALAAACGVEECKLVAGETSKLVAGEEAPEENSVGKER